MTSTTQSPVHEITQAEENANRRSEEAKQFCQKEVTAFRTSEADRVDGRKKILKEQASEELKQEKEKLGGILKKGEDALKKEKEKIQSSVQKNEGGIVQFLVDTFLDLQSCR